MISVTTGMLLPFVMGGVLATPYLPMLYRRATDSFDVALAAYEERFQQGIQPSTPVINLYSHDTQETLLVVMNAGYMVATCCLYLFMRRRDKPFQLRRVLTVYNMVNVLLSTYISAAIIMYKFKGGQRRLHLQQGRARRPGPHTGLCHLLRPKVLRVLRHVLLHPAPLLPTGTQGSVSTQLSPPFDQLTPNRSLSCICSTMPPSRSLWAPSCPLTLATCTGPS